MSTTYTPLTDEQIMLLAVTHARFVSETASVDYDEDADFVDLVAEMLPALLAENADLRAKDERLAEVLNVRLTKYAADLAEYAPVKLGEYSPALCVETAIGLVRAALTPASENGGQS